MENVRIKKSELKTIVEQNRTKHRTAYEQAFDGYRKTCIEVLETNLTAFRSGKAQRVMISEAPPEDHTKDYDRLLRMLDLSIDEDVTLDSSAFSQFVMDEWQWKDAWIFSNTKYIDKAR